MPNNKRYYYLKLKENFFDSDSMILLENMKDGYLYSNILLKLYLRSLKDEGRLLLNGRIPYNSQMIASLTRHQVGTVEKALEVLQQIGLVEVLESGVIYMLDIQNFIGQSSTEADRQREYYNRISTDKSCKKSNMKSCKNSDKISTPEIRDRDRVRDRDKDRVLYQQIADMYNDTCVSFPRLTKLSDKRKKAIRARLNTYTEEDFQKLFRMAEESSFLKGQNNRNWSATFDWLITDANMAKVLDGNYADRKEEKGSEQQNRRPASDYYLQFMQGGKSNPGAGDPDGGA